MVRKELIKTICNKLNEKGFLEDAGYFTGEKHPYSPDEGFGATLQYLPVDNLKKMSMADISEFKDFKQVYDFWGKQGFFKFTPYIIDKDDNPSLVIRRDMFLHMFRGYRFQVSSTADGKHTVCDGSYPTNFMTSCPREFKILRKGLVGYMLWWAAAIDAAFNLDKFRATFKNNREVIETFINYSRKYWNAPKPYNYTHVDDFIKYSKDTINTYERNVYQLIDKKTGNVYLHFAMGEKTIQVESSRGLITLELPQLDEGTDYNMEDEYDYADYESEVEYMKANHYIEMLTVMVIALAGININFTGWWFNDEHLTKISPVNSPDVINVASLNDIYKQEPDKF